MKKELHKLTFVTAAIFAAISTRVALGEQSLTANQAAGLRHGSAMLAVEDLKVLLGAHSRIPSSGDMNGLQESPAIVNLDVGSFKLPMNLDGQNRRRLSAKLARTEADRNRATLAAETKLKKATQTLKAQRHNLQMKRIQGDSSEIQKELFENILSEANLKARHQQALGQLAQKHAVTLSFFEVDGERIVQSIAMAGVTLWSNKSTTTAKFP